MTAVDTNILVYAHREDSDWHRAALEALVGLATSGQPWGIPWSCVHEFLAITTHPRIYAPPSPPPIALEAIRQWLTLPNCHALAEGPGYYETLQRVVEAGKVRGPVIHDARIAALCLHHGVLELWTADRDFSCFPDLRCRNPLSQ